MKLTPNDGLPPSVPVDYDPFAEGELLLTAPATEAQQEIWASVQLGSEANCAYNESISLTMQGSLNIKALALSLQTLIQRHDALRTTLSPDGSTLCISPGHEIELVMVDLSNEDLLTQPSSLAAIKKQGVECPFDLEHGPLFRAQLVKCSEQSYSLLCTAHHIICDGWSWGVLMPELGKIYSSLVLGSELVLGSGLVLGFEAGLEAPEAFSTYAIQQKNRQGSAEALATETYWVQQFCGSIPVLDLPTDFPRPLVRTFNSARMDWTLSSELVGSLKQLGRNQGCSFMTVLLAGFEVFLHRLTGAEDLVVGVPTAGQSAEGQYNLVGHCVNLLPLRSRLRPTQPLSRYLQERRAPLLDAYEHQQFTFGSVVKTLSLPRDPSRIPLVSVVLNLDRALEGESLGFEGLTVELTSNPRAFENFEWFINATEYRDRLVLECQYNTTLWTADSIHRRLAEFETLLRGMVANPDLPIALLPVLSDSEQRLLDAWNQTQRSFPQNPCLHQTLCLHQLVEAQVEKTPDAVAAVFGQECLTYQELNSQANQLARSLQQLGVGPEVLVGICVERSLEMLVGLLGILKAGGAFVPLDPQYPLERLAYMVTDAQIAVLVTQQSLISALPDYSGSIVSLDGGEGIHEPNTGNLDLNVSLENLAYILYTSGSTGKPKGVKIQHSSIVNLLSAVREKPGLTATDTVLSVATISFDIALSELFLPLIVGARVVIASREAAKDGSQLVALLRSSGTTFFQPTPSTWRLLLAAGWQGDPHLTAISTGEALPKDLATQLLPKVGTLWNLYGPTETTIWCTGYRIDSLAGPIMIGSPLANTQAYILDSHLQPVPIGVAGELYIGGLGVARGYLNRPGLTAERFLPNPFDPDGRLYKTGDLARFHPDGSIEWLGRLDLQVKVRGFRIELGEIEAVLLDHPQVEEAVVIVREDDPNIPSLVAYYVSSSTEALGESDQSSFHLQSWNQRWDLLYKAGTNDAAILQQLTGEQSTFQDQIQEWLGHTLATIRSLNPQRVLELGCGTGQLLLEIAPQCQAYVGTDYAESAIHYLRAQVEKLPQVSLYCQAADDFSHFEPGSFDTVILHSVAQYFPDISYLKQVIKGAINTLKPGGCLYVGDIQSLALLETYHTSAQLTRSPGSLTLETLKSIIQNRISNEDELVVDPGFFYALKASLPILTRVEIRLRQGQYWNETTQFHYDVILQVGDFSQPVVTPSWQDWQTEGWTIDRLRQQLFSQDPDWWCFAHIPNARIQKECLTLASLQNTNPSETVTEFTSRLAGDPGGIDPAELWALEKDFPYQVHLLWSDAAAEGCFEAIVIRNSLCPVPTFLTLTEQQHTRQPLPWEAYANRPMPEPMASSQPISRLREFLRQRLPEYMVPVRFVALPALPLTPNGKFDRQALPAPDRARPEVDAPYEAPKTPTEETIAAVWSKVLRLERVGISDNFFELGGHSLLAIQVVARLRQIFALELSLSTLFQSPTIADLAQQIENLVWVTQSPLKRGSNPSQQWEYEEGVL